MDRSDITHKPVTSQALGSDSAERSAAPYSEDAFTESLQHLAAKVAEEHRLDLNDTFSRVMGNGGAQSGRRLTATAMQMDFNQQQSQKHKNTALQHYMLLLLNAHLQSLYQRLEALYDRLSEIAEERADLNEAKMRLHSDIKYWDQLGQQARRDGDFERHASGALKNQRLIHLITQHKDNTGQDINHRNFESVFSVVDKQQIKLEQTYHVTIEQDHLLSNEAENITIQIDETEKSIIATENAVQQMSLDSQYSHIQINTSSLRTTDQNIAQTNYKNTGFQFNF